MVIGKSFVENSRGLLCQEYLPKIEQCLEVLDEVQVWWRPNDSCNSVGNLILHLCGNVNQWVVSGIGGAPDQRERQVEFDERGPIARSELIARLKGTLIQADAVLGALTDDSLLDFRRIQGLEVRILEAVYHVVEHFSMHTGQIIILTKMLSEAGVSFYDFSTGVPVSKSGVMAMTPGHKTQ